MTEDIIIELSRLERRAHERVRERCARLQMGQAFHDLFEREAENAIQESTGAVK